MLFTPFDVSTKQAHTSQLHLWTCPSSALPWKPGWHPRLLQTPQPLHLANRSLLVMPTPKYCLNPSGSYILVDAFSKSLIISFLKHAPKPTFLPLTLLVANALPNPTALLKSHFWFSTAWRLHYKSLQWVIKKGSTHRSAISCLLICQWIGGLLICHFE